MFCDTHCHLFSEYYHDVEEVINISKESFVNKMIVSGSDRKSNEEVLSLLGHEEIYGTLGIHPEAVHDYTNEDLEFIMENLGTKKIVAIGEIGLDYHYEKENREEQIKLFEEQLKIAEDYHLPVVVHSREATMDTINCLKKYKVRGVIHSFSGSLEVARTYIDMGFFLGVNGVVTFKNCHLIDVIKTVGVHNIVLETDAPYLTPVPFRGKRNDPGKVSVIAEYISDACGVKRDNLVTITNENVHQVFDI